MFYQYGNYRYEGKVKYLPSGRKIFIDKQVTVIK